MEEYQGQKFIIIKGAAEHNLKNINLELPRDRLIVITGLSGSGKSSLAFDTLYAEGQRRYVESLSAYARQFLEQMEKPAVESIEGLSPAISIEQKTVSRNPRSTVGTITEIYDYLRVLFSSIGKPHCPECGDPITSQSAQQIVDIVLSSGEDTRIIIKSPIIRGKKGEYRKQLKELAGSGYTRAEIDGEVKELSEEIELDKNKKHDINVIIDRLKIRDGIESRLTDSIETALRLAEGLVIIEDAETGENKIYSEKLACIKCGISLPELTPRMFSFNSPFGACKRCSGLGKMHEFSEDKVIPDESLSLMEGAVAPWPSSNSDGWMLHMFKDLGKALDFNVNAAFRDLPDSAKQAILYGTDKPIKFKLERENLFYSAERKFEGVMNWLTRRYKQTNSEAIREGLEKYMSFNPCTECGGKRLKKETLAVKVDGKNISEFTDMSIAEALETFSHLNLDTMDQKIADRVLKEIHERLHFLENVGLNYLSLNREAATLSGGEGQRIRLATQIGSSLTGVLYILDEPSIGLHQRDNNKLLDTLKKMRDLGNTVIVVEHDEATIRSADWVVDLGPGAGVHGGEIVCAGEPSAILECKNSLTGQYLSGNMKIEIPTERVNPNHKFIKINGASHHNLKNVNIAFPTGCFIAVTGVSGSGKSTLVNETLYPALARFQGLKTDEPGPYETIEGLENIDKVIDIDQSPIGRTPRSNPATYTGLFTEIRDLYTQVPESKVRGYKAGRFSFNVKGGRCETCKGDGVIKIEMHFLPDVYVTCDLCKGKRYNRETLDIKYKGLSIADVLDLTVSQALEFFDNHPRIKRKLETLNDVGLGYIKLGQPATTLSGGEAQRIKLSRELSKLSTGKTLYILDEPTTGLHFDDIKKLLAILHQLRDMGNTVIVIEHNLDVIKTADWIIDLGPEGGDRGGYLIGEGTPEKIASIAKSYTGQFLKEVL
ncbi:MAG: excinuclease ABC subunit UvrA [Acidobacteria bacterium]|nr:excinuclease ABC subunit UvrA [Acidobacteriota bacterium]